MVCLDPSTLLQHLETFQFLFASFAVSLFLVATLATGIRWWSRLFMGMNTLFWSVTAISIKYPEIIDLYMNQMGL